VGAHKMMNNGGDFRPLNSSLRQTGALSASHSALLAVLLAAAAGAAYYFGSGDALDTARGEPEPPEATTISSPPPPPPLTEDDTAAIEEEANAAPAEPVLPEPVTPPLPPLSESDDAVRDALGAIPLGTPGQQYLLTSNIIERSSSALYLMAQGDVPYKLIPIARPKIPFPISDDGLKVTADPEGFSRYDSLSSWLRQIDIAAIIDALHWFVPLFREAWSFYGDSPEEFDAAVLNTLDAIVSTPEIDLSEARLIRKEAVWIYEDPAVEALAPLQKQILRMGPDNALIVKAVAGQTRDIWLSTMGTE
jgi:hypothetical protein